MTLLIFIIIIVGYLIYFNHDTERKLDNNEYYPSDFFLKITLVEIYKDFYIYKIENNMLGTRAYSLKPIETYENGCLTYYDDLEEYFATLAETKDFIK